MLALRIQCNPMLQLHIWFDIELVRQIHGRLFLLVIVYCTVLYNKYIIPLLGQIWRSHHKVVLQLRSVLPREHRKV